MELGTEFEVILSTGEESGRPSSGPRGLGAGRARRGHRRHRVSLTQASERERSPGQQSVLNPGGRWRPRRTSSPTAVFTAPPSPSPSTSRRSRPASSSTSTTTPTRACRSSSPPSTTSSTAGTSTAPGIPFRGLSWADSLVKLPAEGFYMLRKALSFDGGEWPKASLVQLGYTRTADPILFIGQVRAQLAENDLWFSDRGVGVTRDQLALLEAAADLRGARGRGRAHHRRSLKCRHDRDAHPRPALVRRRRRREDAGGARARHRRRPARHRARCRRAASSSTIPR